MESNVTLPLKDYEDMKNELELLRKEVQQKIIIKHDSSQISLAIFWAILILGLIIFSIIHT